MWNTLIEEFLIRQMFWMFHGEECKKEMKKLVLKTKNNENFLNKFETEPNFKMSSLDKFNEDLHNLKLFDQIVDIISNDKKYLDSLVVEKNVRELVVAKMSRNFKSLFTECSDEGKNQIKEIITNNLQFADYFDEINDELYDNFKVSEILKDENIKNKEEILKYAFESQKGNSLLIITFFAQKKAEEKGFLEELEKNYGIYLDVDNFIKDMNKKIEEIKSFKELYEFIGVDFGKDKTDMELIIEAYDKANEKGYIKSDNRLSRSQNSDRGINRRGSNRDRGFRGRGFSHGRGGFNRGRGGFNRGRGGFNRGRGGFSRCRGGLNRGRGFDRNRTNSRYRSRSRSRSN